MWRKSVDLSEISRRALRRKQLKEQKSSGIFDSEQMSLNLKPESRKQEGKDGR